MLITNGTPFCSATCAMAEAAPESNGPLSMLQPSAIRRSARARGIDIGFEIDDDNLDRLGIADLLEQRRGDVGAALAGLADTGLHPRQRQDHADFQRPALRTPDVERCGAGEQTRGACAGGEAT